MAKDLEIKALQPLAEGENVPARTGGGGPVHPLSAGATMALDLLWTLPELSSTPSVVGLLPLSFGVALICFVTVYQVERRLGEETTARAIAKALALAVAAGVPFPVMGTSLGAALLAWSGLGRIFRKG